MEEQFVLFLRGVTGAFSYGDSTVIFFAELFPIVVIAGVVVLTIGYFYMGRYRAGYTALGGIIAALAGWIAAHFLKFLFQQERPYVSLDNLTPLFEHESLAFPSGHTAFFFALALVLWRLDRRVGVVVFIAAVFIGVGRVAAGVHWPIDIVGGAVLGAILAFGVIMGLRKFEKRSL